MLRFVSRTFPAVLLAEGLAERLTTASQLLQLTHRFAEQPALRATLRVVLLEGCRSGANQLLVDALDACDPDENGVLRAEQATIVEVVDERRAVGGN